MIVVRKYEVTIPDEVLEMLDKEGYGSGGLIDTCTRAHDEGENGIVYLIQYNESDRIGEETSKIGWVTIDDLDEQEDKVLLKVEDWSCEEIGWEIQA